MTSDYGPPPQPTPTADLTDTAYTVRDRARLALCYSAYKLALAARALVGTEDDWWVSPGHYVGEAVKLMALANEVMERAVIMERECGTRWSAIAVEDRAAGARAAVARRWAKADRRWRAAVEAQATASPSGPSDRSDRSEPGDPAGAAPGGATVLPPAGPINCGAAVGHGGPRLPGGAADPAGAAAILDAWFTQTAPPGSRLGNPASPTVIRRADRSASWSKAGVLPIPGQARPGRALGRTTSRGRARPRPITDGLAMARRRDRGIADRRLKSAIEDVLIAAAPLTELAAVPAELVHLVGPLRTLIEAREAGVGHVRLRRAAFELVCAPLVPLGQFPEELDEFANALAVLRHAIERV